MTTSSSKKDDADKATEDDHTVRSVTRVFNLTRTKKPRACPAIPEDEESAESDDSSTEGMKNMKRHTTDRTAVKEGGLRAVGTKKLETVLKKRKEKQSTRDWEDAMINIIVETQNTKLDPELIMKNVKELFGDRMTETIRGEKIMMPNVLSRCNKVKRKATGNGS
jgi:hypothetical protein